MKYDEILEHIGGFGPYQKRAYFLLCIPSMMKAAIVMSAVFVLSLPDYRCAIPGLSNDTFKVQGSQHSLLINRTIPPASPDQEYGGVYSHCKIYANASLNMDEFTNHNKQIMWLNATIVTSTASGMWNFITNVTGTRWNSTEERDEINCHSWVYDKSEVRSSIMTEFDFVCDKKVMRSHTNMGFFGGSLVGSFLIGTIADILGRKKALLICILLQMVCGTTLYFLTSVVAVVVVRSIQGMAGEMFAISASTGMELVEPKKRTFAGMVIEFFWSGGQLVVLLVAFLTKDWRLTELVFGLASVPLLLAICFTPESPRWLLDKGRYDEAQKILSKIAKSNKTTLPPDAFDDDRNDVSSRQTIESTIPMGTIDTNLPVDAAAVTKSSSSPKSSPTSSPTPSLKVWKLFSNRILLLRSIIVFYNWFAVNFLYYGLSLNLDNLSGSLYLNFLISLGAETLGFVLCILLLDRTGRKSLHIFCMIFGGLACLAVIFPVVYGNEDHQWIITTLSMVGKLAAGSCYSILYIMSVELFPTVVRNSALGVSAVFENVAGMVAPYISDLGILVGGSLSSALPTTVFGCVAVLGGLLSLYLPETLHKPLPETIEDALKLGEKRRQRESQD